MFSCVSGIFSTFEAMETLVWGTPETGTTVQRRWSGHLVRR